MSIRLSPSLQTRTYSEPFHERTSTLIYTGADGLMRLIKDLHIAVIIGALNVMIKSDQKIYRRSWNILRRISLLLASDCRYCSQVLKVDPPHVHQAAQSLQKWTRNFLSVHIDSTFIVIVKALWTVPLDEQKDDTNLLFATELEQVQKILAFGYVRWLLFLHFWIPIIFRLLLLLL